jgi:hypothetical protein
MIYLRPFGFANCTLATFGDRKKKVDCHKWPSMYKKSGY